MAVGTGRYREERPGDLALADERLTLNWSEADAKLDLVAGSATGSVDIPCA